LQALEADLQALVPLHELAPTQWPIASAAYDAGADTAPARSIVAAAAARAEPDVAIIFMGDFLLRMNLNVNATRGTAAVRVRVIEGTAQRARSFSLGRILLAIA
jgi:hypothetical protein